MAHKVFELHQLTDEIQPLESGKETRVLTDDADVKVVLFAFAGGDGLREHSAQVPAIIQILKGNAALTVGDELISGNRNERSAVIATTWRFHRFSATHSSVQLLQRKPYCHPNAFLWVSDEQEAAINAGQRFQFVWMVQ